MADPTDTSLRAALERTYDEIRQRKGKRRRDPPKPLIQETSRLQDREQFIKLCQRAWDEEHPKKVKGVETTARPTVARARGEGQPQKALRPHVVRVWIEEYKNAANGATVWFTCPASYGSFVRALADAQAEGDLDLRKEAVRRLLGGGTFEAGVMRNLGTRPRVDALQREILPIVKACPTITARELLAKLKLQAGPAPRTIASVRPGVVEWVGPKGRVRKTQIHALAARLIRLKTAIF
jgi:hypothetical protein